jgi:hypothetical protein
MEMPDADTGFQFTPVMRQPIDRLSLGRSAPPRSTGVKIVTFDEGGVDILNGLTEKKPAVLTCNEQMVSGIWRLNCHTVSW